MTWMAWLLYGAVASCAQDEKKGSTATDPPSTLEDRGSGFPTSLFGAGRDMFFAHVGHSRAYLFREGVLMRLTRDHAIGRNQSTTVPVAPLVDVNATARDLKHILTSTIGMRGSAGPAIDLERFRLADKDVVLVCTNGLTDALDENAISDVLAAHESPDHECRELVERALAAGAEDDVTALVAEYQIPN